MPILPPLRRFDGARLRVGPESAGANPGPASYRRGGPLAVTDANVMLGKIQPAGTEVRRFEDNNATIAAYVGLGGLGRYVVDVENFESIHNHSAYAMIQKTR